MKTFKISLLLLLPILFILACSQTQTTNPNSNTTVVVSNTMGNVITTPSATPDELASARKIYSEVCVRCHKENGEGGVIETDIGKLKVPNLKTEGKMKDPDSEFIEQIEEGGDGMPAFKNKLSEQEIKDLVRFIRKDIQGKQ
jgi:mono/diheme cytochrome c family protein